MDRLFLVAGALSAGISVAAGAFGAHALKARLPPDLLAVFHTATRQTPDFKVITPGEKYFAVMDDSDDCSN